MPTVPFLGSYGDISGSGLMFRNKIINGDMRIDQRNSGNSITPTIASFPLDRWRAGIAVSSKITFQQSSTAPAFFSKSLAATVFAAYSPAAGEVFRLEHKVEGFNCADFGWGSSSARTVTLSFWARSSVTGNYAVAFQNSAANRSYVSTYTINAANTWEYKTITIPGDTSGTWLADSGIGVNLAFTLQSGSNFNTTANAWQAGEYFATTGLASWLPTAGATFYITGVQLEAGPVATPFEYRPIGTELALCQRYCYVIPADAAMGFAFVKPGGTSSDYFYFHPVIMRGNPVVTSIGGTTSFSLFAYSGGSTSTSTFSTPFANTRRILLLLSGHGALTVGTTASVDIGTAPLAVSAEL